MVVNQKRKNAYPCRWMLKTLQTVLKRLILHFRLSKRLFYPPNGLRYLRWGWGRRSRPTGKMLRCRKLIEIRSESPASGARFVGRACYRNYDFDYSLKIKRGHDLEREQGI